MVRAFIAIDMDDCIRERIAAVQKELLRSSAKLTLVDPAIAHITLKFLGELDDRTLRAVQEALATVPFEPFAMTIAGVAGNAPSRPRVIWANADDAGACSALARAVERALAPAGIPREKRAFTPHVTIARVRQYDPSLAEYLQRVAATSFGTVTVSHLRLKKSTLTPSGPRYETIMEVSG
ncbi:MAG: RNA 2',3'-cyclic phosphodiesterase [Methanomicrobiales archaeon]|nr:RNA 2',3'-cyclic phosphodiesterase [Methanomicrobiales archaeon]